MNGVDKVINVSFCDPFFLPSFIGTESICFFLNNPFAKHSPNFEKENNKGR